MTMMIDNDHCFKVIKITKKLKLIVNRRKELLGSLLRLYIL